MDAVSLRSWVEDRVPTDLVHLDAAAAGRPSRQVLEAQVAHLRREAEVGAHVVEAEADLEPGRAALAAQVGLGPADLFLAEGAAAALACLLDTWPLEPGARIGTVPGQFGGHARLLAARARQRGWSLVELPVDSLGRITDLPAGLDLVTAPHVASQRGVVQPVAHLLAAGVPVLLDVAQSLGQTEVPPGTAAYVGTSRKWLCGPRGVGFGVVDPAWQPGLAEAVTLQHYEGTAMARYDSAESNVAGRVGLAVAARTWSPALLPVVQAAARAARVLLEGAGGWRVVEPVAEPTGITTLRHGHADPGAVRAALLAEDILVGAVPQTRAADLSGPLLRVATAAWVTPGDLERLAMALEKCTPR